MRSASPPWIPPGPSCSSAWWRGLRTTVPRHRLALAVRGLGPLPARAHHRGQPPRSTAAPRRRRRHRGRAVPHEASPIEGRTPRAEDGLITHEGWGLLVATTGDFHLAIDSLDARHAHNRLAHDRARVIETPGVVLDHGLGIDLSGARDRPCEVTEHHRPALACALLVPRRCPLGRVTWGRSTGRLVTPSG